MGIHLVAPAVAKGGGGAGGVPEGAVEGGGVLGGIGHNGGVFVAVFIQDFPNGGNPAIHHIRGGHHIRSCLDVGQGGFAQNRQGFVIVHGMTMDNAAVAVVGVLAHAHIGDHIALGISSLDGADALLDNAVGIPGGGAAGVLVGGNTKEQHPADTGGHTGGDFLPDPVGGAAPLALQRGDGFPDMLPLYQKQGIHQTVRGYPGFPHHPAQIVTGTQPAWAVYKFHIVTLL